MGKPVAASGIYDCFAAVCGLLPAKPKAASHKMKTKAGSTKRLAQSAQKTMPGASHKPIDNKLNNSNLRLALANTQMPRMANE
jgi:hypothetical protein